MPSREPRELVPDWSIHPGAILRQVLEQRGIRQAELAERTGLTAKHINQIVTGGIGISGDVALLLERALDIDARFWTRADADYQAYTSKQKAKAQVQEYTAWADKFDAATLSRYGITEPGDEPATIVEKILRFFGVASPEAFEQTWLRPRVSFRRSQAFTVAEQNTALWLRLVERSAEHVIVPQLRPGLLRKAARTIPAMTNLAITDGFIAARIALAEAGVILTFVREVPETRVCGATWWLEAHQPVIALTARGRKPDTFWFNLLHEAGHILLHARRTTFLDLDMDKTVSDPAEQQANTFAQDMLLPAAARAQIAQAATREQLLLLAARLGVGVTIVAGHHGHATSKWNIGGTLRGKITDDDIEMLERISGSQGDRANLTDADQQARTQVSQFVAAGFIRSLMSATPAEDMVVMRSGSRAGPLELVLRTGQSSGEPMARVEWSRLSGDEVEAVVAILLCREYPDAIRVKPSRGDGGIDVWAPDPAGVKIFQIKSYTGNIDPPRQRHIKESWEALMGYLRPRSITVTEWSLALPENPTIQQNEWLQGLTKEASFPRFWRGLEYLDGLAAKYPDVIDYYLRDGKERLDAVVREYLSLAGLSNPASPPSASIQTLRQLHNALNEFDPHFYYDFSVDTLSSSNECPPVPNTPRLVAAYQTSDGMNCITFKIIARFNEALKERPVPSSMTLIAEEGSEAQDQIEDWIKFGTPIENIPAEGINVDLPGGFDGRLETGFVSFRPLGPVTGIGAEVTLRVLGEDGAALASLDFVADEQTVGFERTGLRSVGHDNSANVLRYELRFDSVDRTVSVNLVFADATGSRPADVLPVLRFMETVTPPNKLQIFTRNGPALTGPADISTEMLDQRTAATLIRVCEALSTIQEHVFQTVRIPDLAVTTWDTLEAWVETATLLQGQQLTGTWTELLAHLRPGVQPPAGAESVTQVAPMFIRVGENIHPVGTAVMQAASAKVDPIRDPEPHDDHLDVWLVPADTDVVTKRLVPPGQVALSPNAY